MQCHLLCRPFVLLAFALPSLGLVASGAPPDLPPGASLPGWPRPLDPSAVRYALPVRSAELELLHPREVPGEFTLSWAGKPLAVGQSGRLVGCVVGEGLQWFDLATSEPQKRSVRAVGNAIQVEGETVDPAGGLWRFAQRFSPGPVPGSIEVHIRLSVDRERAVAFLPILTLFARSDGGGGTRGQGLFAGLEYLQDEPSSSEADLVGPAAKRQVPDNLKITFPLMVVQREDRYVGLTWQMQPEVSALFDCPDRLLGSSGSVMGLLFPGSDGRNRTEGSLLPKQTVLLHSGEPVRFVATILAGVGTSVVPAVRQYVALRGLPPVPAADMPLADYVAQAAGGWLDSQIRQTNLVRHATAGGNFPPQAAADAALWMDWLATQARDPGLAERLRSTARGVLSAVPPAERNASGVGHVRYPLAALVYGHVAENVAQARQFGRAVLGRFEPDGSVKYRPASGGPDYGRTHSTNEANGFTSRSVLDLLEASAFSGDTNLLSAALRRLEAMDHFRDGVPRGAQTWECPLHTPDILASAQMVRAYILGYELTGQARFLEQARYWAWTGVPFVYLVNPADKPLGPYATIAVFGATQWQAPVWLGLPVQWCGLVYAEALYRLVRHDPAGPWKQLADGITMSGIQQDWPAGSGPLQGLLPDSVTLRSQDRNGPAINPATVQACAVRHFGPTAYDFWCFRQSGLLLHAPGEIQRPLEKTGTVSFLVSSWVDHAYFILLNGFSRKPQVTVNGQPVELSDQFDLQEGRLILQLQGKPLVELTL